mmetsp:Transcript_26649/g.86084  ORF Transcript_26649/g.86084 Transcript_26649/m.86084 type:complete len:367 (-) Transcript_26649:61-1161(-)
MGARHRSSPLSRPSPTPHRLRRRARGDAPPGPGGRPTHLFASHGQMLGRGAVAPARVSCHRRRAQRHPRPRRRRRRRARLVFPRQPGWGGRWGGRGAGRPCHTAAACGRGSTSTGIGRRRALDARAAEQRRRVRFARLKLEAKSRPRPACVAHAAARAGHAYIHSPTPSLPSSSAFSRRLLAPSVPASVASGRPLLLPSLSSARWLALARSCLPPVAHLFGIYASPLHPLLVHTFLTHTHKKLTREKTIRGRSSSTGSRRVSIAKNGLDSDIRRDARSLACSRRAVVVAVRTVATCHEYISSFLLAAPGEVMMAATNREIASACRRVPCRKARPRCGRGQVRGVWRRSCRERLAPGLLCRRSVGRS